MLLLSILCTLCLTCRLSDAFGFRGFHFEGLEDIEVPKYSSHNVETRWIEQPLDHFNPQDNRVWQMRYLENSDLFKEGGPIFIMIGGEWEISSGYLVNGLMYDIGRAHNAALYYTEHRYYGKSHPTADTSTKNLQYLSVDQSLADLSYFIESKKKEKGLENSTVVVFGGSYGGNMAAWSRLKYPHLIQGAVASSAPVFAKANFYEYYQVVAESLRRHSQQCVDNIAAAFSEAEKLLTVQGGPEKLKSYFNLCNVLKVNSTNDVGYFMSMLAEKFAGAVQYDSKSKGRINIETCCNAMTKSNLGTPLQRLARLVRIPLLCILCDYDEFVKTYTRKGWEVNNNMMRQWTYQTCTEYGYYQTSTSIFGSGFPLSYYTAICTDLYSDYFNNNFLNSQVKRTNIMYGGLRPDLRNVIFVNGNIDPWHALSVLKDLNPFSPAILINGTSHCADMKSDESSDSEELILARKRVKEIVSSWVMS